MLPLILGGVSALASYKNAQNKNDQMQKANQAAAEQTRYSAWSGLGQGQINNQYADPLTSAIGGGLQGAAFGQSLGSLGAKPTDPWAALEAEMNQPSQASGINAYHSRGMNT
ncbi:MAG: hypothetical protein KF767_08805 [Bdellovibrionaceae bacterium]|nr:hypothetical protein [Pseudobdellovibrionaceae bacterium]